MSYSAGAVGRRIFHPHVLWNLWQTNKHGLIEPIPYVMPRGRKRKRVFRSRFRRRKRRRYNRGRIFHVEKKLHDVAATFSTSVAASAAIQIVEIAQGVTQNSRIGLCVAIKGIHLRWDLQMPAGGLNNTIVRIGLFCWKQQEADAGINLNQVYENPFDPLSYLNHLHFGEFKILWSRTYVLSQPAVNPQGASRRIVRKDFRFRRPLLIKYNGPVTTDIQKNGLFVFAMSNASVGTETTSGFSARVRFTDM